jgi:hypothetical protein
MADRFAVSYEMGGTLRAQDIPTLVDAVLSDGFSLNYGSEDSPEALKQELQECARNERSFIVSACEIAWGRTETLDEFCREHRLHYLKRVEGKYEYNGALHWWKPGMKAEQEWNDTDKDATQVMVSLTRLKKFLRCRKTLKRVIQELSSKAPTPPPLRIQESRSRRKR